MRPKPDSDRTQTQDKNHLGPSANRPTVPGVLLVHSAGLPRWIPIPLVGGQLELGRGLMKSLNLDDSYMSRHHARVSFDGRVWSACDLGSRNGSSIDGAPLTAEVSGAELKVLRTGDTIFLLQADMVPFQAPIVSSDERVQGPTLRVAEELIERAGSAGETLHITGDSGVGKELAARAFHRASPRANGPFIPVNCAAIPEGMAERLFFGARRGAFSGAHADAEGYVQAANGGVLFLDEIGELDLAVQAKLLRVLESREVLPLGASRSVTVDVQICSATNRPLRDLVAQNRFREDLFFRVGRPQVRIPPLRERLEEIPFLIARELKKLKSSLLAHVSLVETCLARPWPGNVRELMAEIREAARAAQTAGATQIAESHLSAGAGRSLAAAARPESVDAGSSGPGDEGGAKGGTLPSREVIEEALRRANGRVASAARRLGLHRNRLRRWLARHEVDPLQFGNGDAGGADASDAADERGGDDPADDVRDDD